jgi:hypothetical protein
MESLGPEVSNSVVSMATKWKEWMKKLMYAPAFSEYVTVWPTSLSILVADRLLLLLFPFFLPDSQ